jgi:hypothetical protein
MSKPGFIQTALMGLVLMFSSGCATIVTGSDMGYPVISQPVGAKVSVNGLHQGNMPLYLDGSIE